MECGRSDERDDGDGQETTELIEIYKLHANLAEQVATMREGLNKLYVGIVSSILAACVLLQRFAPSEESSWTLPGLGILVSICWLLSLKSVTGRLRAKHAIIVKLEQSLPFDFLSQENHEFEEQRFLRRKWSGALMPVCFLLVCVVWFLVAVTPIPSSS